MRTDNKSISPTLAEVIQVQIDSNLIDLHTCLPAKIVSYDSSTQYASVEIQLQRKYEDGTMLPWPVIANVPVKHPRCNGGQTYIHMPLTVGDDVVLVMSERSLDNWKTQGGMQDPQDRRKFNITDAYALIGGSAVPDAFTLDDDQAVTIKHFLSTLEMKKTGKYKIKGGLSDELISILSDFMASISRAFTTTSLGPEPLVDPQDPGFTLIQQRLNAFKG